MKLLCPWPMMKHATLCNAVVELGACPRASRTYPAKPLLRGRGVGVCELILLESHALLTSCLLWHAVMVHPPCSLRRIGRSVSLNYWYWSPLFLVACPKLHLRVRGVRFHCLSKTLHTNLALQGYIHQGYMNYGEREK